MKQLSLWANKHKWKARIVMTIAWILLTVLAIITGKDLAALNITLSYTVLLIIIAAFFAAIFYYPLRSKRHLYPASSFYTKQKTCDLLLAVCSFCMVVYAANRPDTLFQQYGDLYAATPSGPSLPKDSTVKTYSSIKDFAATMKNEEGKMLKWKERRKLLKQQVKAIKRSDDLSKGAKIALTFLSVLAALGLLYLVAALACGISCNGSQAGAVIVGLSGVGLVVFLLVLAMRGIYGGKKKRKARAEQITGS